MSDEHEDRPAPDSIDQPPVDTSRRRFLGGAAVLGVGATLSACGNPGDAPGKPLPRPLTPQELDKALHDQVKTVVVIYAENRSFNNLFADFPGLEKPLSALSPADYQQRDRDASVLTTLPPVWGGVLQVGSQSVDGVTYPSEVQFQENLPNAPFALKGPNAEDLPLSLVTRDLWHVFYQNQMQINGGKNDNFVAWADSGGLVMGHYAQSRYSLRLWDVAKEFVLCDNFFQGAFGGSFLNPPIPDQRDRAGLSERRAVGGQGADRHAAKRRSHRPTPQAPGQIPGQRHERPAAVRPERADPGRLRREHPGPALLADLDSRPRKTRTTPSPTCPTCWCRRPTNTSVTSCRKRTSTGPGTPGPGKRRWNSSRTRAAFRRSPTSSTTTSRSTTSSNRARKTARSVTSACATAGLGDESSTNKFFADAQAGKLPAVTFYKPQGNLNMHAGYADVASGDRHITRALKVLQESPQWKNMVVVVTVDENGGWWDHVAPPKGDRWGPGTRVSDPGGVAVRAQRHGGPIRCTTPRRSCA